MDIWRSIWLTPVWEPLLHTYRRSFISIIHLPVQVPVYSSSSSHDSTSWRPFSHLPISCIYYPSSIPFPLLKISMAFFGPSIYHTSSFPHSWVTSGSSSTWTSFDYFYRSSTIRECEFLTAPRTSLPKSPLLNKSTCNLSFGLLWEWRDEPRLNGDSWWELKIRGCCYSW